MGATLHCGARASHCGGFSCCGARALGARASVVMARGLSSCGTRAKLLCGMWDLPGQGMKPVSPALAGGFLTTAPPGKSPVLYFYAHFLLLKTYMFRKKIPRYFLLFPNITTLGIVSWEILTQRTHTEILSCLNLMNFTLWGVFGRWLHEIQGSLLIIIRN